MLNLSRTLPFELKVDGEVLHLQLRRMTIDEFVPFEAQFQAHAKGRKPTADPAAADSVEAFQASVEARAAGGLDYAKWLRDVFEAYVTVQPGDLAIDGEPVTRGGQFVTVMSRYGNAVATVLAELYLRNKLTADQKKTLGSLLASATTSTPAPPTAGSGSAPATAATPAAPSSSAPAAAATAPSSDASSGTTAPLPSGPVPSVH